MTEREPLVAFHDSDSITLLERVIKGSGLHLSAVLARIYFDLAMQGYAFISKVSGFTPKYVFVRENITEEQIERMHAILRELGVSFKRYARKKFSATIRFSSEIHASLTWRLGVLHKA